MFISSPAARKNNLTQPDNSMCYDIVIRCVGKQWLLTMNENIKNILKGNFSFHNDKLMWPQRAVDSSVCNLGLVPPPQPGNAVTRHW